MEGADNKDEKKEEEQHVADPVDHREPQKDEKPDLSPWAEPREDPRKRVVGWRDGGGLSNQDVRDILRNERGARHEYRTARKAVVQKPRGKAASDPLQGLPPTWQAFWSTVPHLDPQAAYRQLDREKKEKDKPSKKAEKRKLQEEPKENQTESLEDETTRLDAEVRRKKQMCAEKEKALQQWDVKLARIKKNDADEEQRSKKTIKRLETASYNHGILEGKIRSSETYFNFLFDDSKTSHAKQTETLKRSCALMDANISELKTEVRELMKAAAEAQPSSPSALPSSSERKALGS